MASAVRTLADIPKLGVLSLDTLAERLLSFVAAYQQANNGDTPAWDVIASQLGILEFEVRPLVYRLENRGLIHVVSRKPLRLMLTQPGQPNPAEPSAADMDAAKPGAYGRFLDAEAERMRLGRFVADTERKHGRGPSLKEMCDFVGWAEPRRVARMAEMLAEKGLLQFGGRVPTKLTPQGRQIFGLKQPEERPEMEQTAKPKTVVVVRTNDPKRRQSANDLASRLCKALAERMRADPERGAYTRYRDLAADMGYSPTSNGLIVEGFRKAVSKGWLRSKPHKVHGLFFTAKGRAKFMPETIEEGMPYDVLPAPEPEAEPAVIKCDEPIVSQVARAVTGAGLGRLDFSLSGSGLYVKGNTNSRAELAAFIGRLGALMPFLGE